MSINIVNALNIDGWMRVSELEWLAEQASQHQNICEVGSWMGRSTRALADNTPGTVFCVDTWMGTPGPKECGERLKGKPEDWLFSQFLFNMHPVLDKLAIYRMTSSYAALALAGSQFDMIFIDAAHDYDNVKADIIAWKPLLAEGGLLCGHDFGGSFPGVKQAVLELLPNAHKAGAGSIWVAE